MPDCDRDKLTDALDALEANIITPSELETLVTETRLLLVENKRLQDDLVKARHAYEALANPGIR